MWRLAREIALGVLVLFLFSLTVVSGRAESEADLSFDAEPAHWWFGCYTCHTLHGTENLDLISEEIDTDYLPPDYAVKSGLREVVFLNQEGPNSYADGDDVYDGVCEVCHTETKYHRSDSSGDQTHFPGTKCTNCHDHSNYFQPTGIANHPRAVTDCSNCHADNAAEPSNLLEIHGFDCQKCHPDFSYDRTILGELGTFQGECFECHNPDIEETGNLQTPTKGHRCILCHGRQRRTRNKREFHEKHTKLANCVVCHGFIPDMGTAIGSGSREICRLCHDTYRDWTRITTIHKEMVPAGLSCLECHGDARPPIDVFPGASVGDATVVCDICHTHKSPSEFRYRSESLHQKHTEKRLDCGFCHADAILQDDREPMPDLDDGRRQLVDRSGMGECRFCHSYRAGRKYSHNAGRKAGRQNVHNQHVSGQWQWCYNCHEGSDDRPTGLAPPVTQPSEACGMCHNYKRYRDAFPFKIHKRHAGSNKCYSCHQTLPQLFDWPELWLSASTVE